MIVMMDYNLYLMSVVVNDLDPYAELKGKLICLDQQVKIFQVFHCEGLLLCILKDDITRYVVWNPYCGQTRWIKPRFSYPPRKGYSFSYALGYENKKSCRSHKF
ncbi:unnamed protein product [Microthlaspi erraticum]|uniref:F-box associated beta-propeller type 1 domain-containing protein n=1 Tax=Microthlaspi erraticum TaxID=1685480 RepID=A0A6D2JYP8_9BRAS|nr:unnamed protein product [Microthlaspi erraticum]